MSTITNFTVTNVDIGKFRFDWTISGPTPQKITISVYSDSGYTTLLYTYSTDPYVSTSGQPDFYVTDTSFSIPNTLSSGVTYYSQISIVPQGVTTITTSVYVSSNQNIPVPRIAVHQSNVIPLNYATPVVYNYNSIGSYYLAGTPSAYFNGFINNLSLYNRTLTTSEISNYFRFSDNTNSFTAQVYSPLPIKLSNFYQTVADAPMYLYFDADSLNQIQGYYVGSSIALWNNLGTDGNAASLNARGAFVGTGTGGYLPTLQQTGGANNYRYFVQFAGSGTGNTGPGNFFTLPPMQFNYTTGFTFIFVANVPASGSYDRIIDFNNGASTVSDTLIIARNSTGGNLGFYFANGVTTTVNWAASTNAVLDNTWRIYAVRITGTNYHYFYNTGTGTKLTDTFSLGTVPTSRTYTSANYTSNGSTSYGSFIGRSNFNDNFSSMKLGELLVYRSALSDNAINGIINVMQKRWNLDTSRTNIDFEFTQNVATFPGTDNTGKTLTTTAPPGMYNDSTRGYVVSLNGSTQFFGISSYNIGPSYTKMFWIYLNSLTGAACHIMSSTNSATSGVHYVYFPAGISNLSFGHSSGTTVLPIVTDPQPLISGVWVHYTVTYENASGAASGYSQYAMTLYRNGQQVAQVTNSANTWTGGSATTGVTIGGYGGTVTGFNGYLDKMRIYARALKQTELQLIYNSEKLNIPVQNYTSSSAGSGIVYTYTGTDQLVTVPSNVTRMTVQAWGAGGASKGMGNAVFVLAGSGGGGGYVQATFSVTTGQQLKVIVGEGGKYSAAGGQSTATYGGGGGCYSLGGDTNWRNASGGGRSAVQLNSGGYSDIITAGAGGAGGGSTTSTIYSCDGGAGGGTTGADGGSTTAGAGKGGTQSAGGAAGSTALSTTGNAPSAGSQYNGGTGNQYACGGGSGYYGGGGAHLAYFNPTVASGGGGGSSYINSGLLAAGFSTVNTQGNGILVANNSGLPSNYANTIGNGGPAPTTLSGGVAGSNGQNGLVIITFF